MSTDAILREAETIKAQALIDAELRRAHTRQTVQNALRTSRVVALDSTIANPEQVLQCIEKLRDITLHINAGGSQFVGTDRAGQTYSAQTLVEMALLANKDLADGRSTRHVTDLNTADELIQAKSDLNQVETMAYIDRYGLPAYECLPLKREIKLPDVDPEEMGKAQYMAMSRQKRTALVAKLSQRYGSKFEQALGAILQRP
jgi:hypothetical protein